MLVNYLTLFHAARLLHERYARTVIAEVYSQEKNTLSIVLYAPEPHTITVRCGARENALIARSGTSRTHKNTVDLFPSLIDRHIESVHMLASDRAVIISLSGGLRLCCELYASAANVVLCDMDGTVTDAFLKKKETVGLRRPYPLVPQPVTENDILPAREEFIRTLTALSAEQSDPRRALKKCAPKLGTILADEIVFRCGITGSSFTETDTARMADAAAGLVRELLLPDRITPSIYFDERSPVALTLIPLQHLAPYRREQYDDLFTGITRFISFGRSESSVLQQKKTYVQWLQKELEKAERTMRAVETEMNDASRAEKYQQYAAAIMANLGMLTKGAAAAELRDPLNPDIIIRIPLESSLTPQKNAERYFEKAKKARSGREESRERLRMLERRTAALQSVIENSKQITDSISLKNFIHSNGSMLKELGYMTEQEHEALPPFKIFTVEGGFTVYAGKNSANNDLLTFRYARPNDLWFHARGSSGSHVVLKLGTAPGEPSKKAVEQAASIAAYYSKMKNAKHVPVAMTERKYIHKPKGAPAGTVALDKEKVIFVQPLLPEQKE
ncbi:MAG: fibronectin/fibrinogen-binding protein [Bacteroidetes bacterium]|nr:fibronectin/fibrinogen-binding protein [Bacteroidota bacterium]